MTALVEVAAVCVAVTAIAVFARSLYRLFRNAVRVHDRILGGADAPSLDDRLAALEKQFRPNGNRPMNQGGTLADGITRLEGAMGLLATDVSDQREMLHIHTATSDLERANLRKAVNRLESEIKKALPPSE